MKLPQNTYANANGSPVVVELLKSLYGLKQAPELWDKFLVSAIKSQGFHQLMHDQCVFIKRTSNNEIIVLIKYVDDIIITGNSQSLIQSTLKHFEHSFTKSHMKTIYNDTLVLILTITKQHKQLNSLKKPYIKKLFTKFNIPNVTAPNKTLWCTYTSKGVKISIQNLDIFVY